MAAFVTAINCIDGRVQSPVSKFLKMRFNVDYVDMITCPAPVVVLASDEVCFQLEHLFQSVMISISRHGSDFIAVAAHHDCAATTLTDDEQREQIGTAVKRILQWQIPVQIIGLWVNSCWKVEEILINEKERKWEAGYELFCKG